MRSGSICDAEPMLSTPTTMAPILACRMVPHSRPLHLLTTLSSRQRAPPWALQDSKALRRTSFSFAPADHPNMALHTPLNDGSYAAATQCSNSVTTEQPGSPVEKPEQSCTARWRASSALGWSTAKPKWIPPVSGT